MINAHQVANDLSSDGLKFGICNEKMAAQLRLLADRIDSHDVIVQDATVTTHAQLEDFTLTKFTLEYADRLQGERDSVKYLYCAHSQFPVAVAKVKQEGNDEKA